MKIVTKPEQLFFSVARLVVDAREAATVFFVADQSRGKDTAPLYFVTAKHVVQSAREVLAYIQTGRSEPDLTAPIEVLLPDRWYYHPDPRVDVAIMDSDYITTDLSAADRSLFIVAVTTEQFVPKWSPAPTPLFEHFRVPQSIDELFFVGYPNNYYDPATGMPVMRRGVTATPLWLDYDSEPAFLMDAAVIHGSSGSPVFHVDWRKGESIQRASRLVGVVSESVRPKHVGELNTGAGPEEHIFLGRIYKAHTVLETIQAYVQNNGA